MRRSEVPRSTCSAGDPIVPPRIVGGHYAIECDIPVAIAVKPMRHRVLTRFHRPCHAASRPWPMTGRGTRRNGRTRCPTAAERTAPLQIEGVIRAPALRVSDVNHHSPARPARILSHLHRSPPLRFRKAEVHRIGRQRRIALKPPPRCRLTRGSCEQPHVARYFHFRGVVHANLNRASPVSAAARNCGPPRNRVSPGCLREHK
jgi:hypothetical protein